MGDWSNLPTDLLQEIGLRVLRNNVTDFIRFGAVCKPWRSVSLEKPKDTPSQIPWMMVTYFDLKGSMLSCFLSVRDSEIYWEKLKLNHPGEFYETCGHGWLFGRTLPTNYCYLLNPITRNRICLPRLFNKVGSETERWHITQAVISSHPTLDKEGGDCVVMAIIKCDLNDSTRLIFCKPGDDKWTAVQDEQGKCDEVTNCDGLFYALNTSKRVVLIFDINPSSSEMEQIALPDSCGQEDIIHIIESFGEVLLLKEFMSERKFDVLKLERNCKSWSYLKSLGDRTIFYSPNKSISVLASNHPMLKRDCIYFSWLSDIVIFGLGGESVECILSGEDIDDESSLHEDVWITPSLWQRDRQ